MQIFWNDCGAGLTSDHPREVDLHEAGLIWSDEVRGVEGNFLGLIDEEGRTIQFYVQNTIPDGVDDASHLPIVLMDFPQPERGGSYGRLVTIGEVHSWIATAFSQGADHRHFGELTFTPW